MELNNERMIPIVSLENIKSDIEYIRSEGNLLMNASDDSSKKTIESNISTRQASVEKALKKYKNDSAFKTLLKDYTSFISAKDTFIKLTAQRSEQNNKQALNQIIQQPNNTSNNGANGNGPTDITNFDTTKTALDADFTKIINTHVAAARQTYTSSESTYTKTIAALATLVILCAVLGAVLSIAIIKSIITPVKSVTNKLKEISQSNGDLTQRINYDSKDEIGQLSKNFDLFMEKLQSMVKEVAISAETISSSSIELDSAASANQESLESISKTVIEIASDSSDGAASTEEITASLSEAAKFSEKTSEASKNTTYNSKNAKEAAEDSALKISEIVTSISEIASSSKDVSLIINTLDSSSKKIGEIVKIITSISEQTNMLALNATIEAARAGEAGKGFNVVAGEIRKLADQTSNAAKEISHLVDENQLKSTSAVKSVNQVEEKVSLGVLKASEAKTGMQNIINNIQKIVTEIEQIENANLEQAQTSNEIQKAISSTAQTSTEIAGNTENMSASIQRQLHTMAEIKNTTEKLSTMAETLKNITCGFTV